MSLEPRVRDIYGLPCIGDYEELLQTYTPIWIELDDCQTHHWERFLAVAAQQLGIREQKGLDDPGVDLSLESPDSHQVVVSVLQQLLARGERHAPELWADLVQHVSNGIPSSLRALAWPILLQPAKPDTQGPWSAQHYDQLVALQQQLYAAVSGLPLGQQVPVTTAGHGSRQQQQQTAALAAAASGPGLAELQALVSASGLALTSEQLLEWQAGCRTWSSQIDKDVHRTFPGHEWLSSPAGQDCLTRLLSCFCLAAPHLGYCQGMNYVAGSLLLLLGPGLTSQQQQQGFSSLGRRSRQHSSSTNSNGGGSNSSSAQQPVTPHTCNGHSDAVNLSAGAPAAAAAAAGGSGGGSFSRRATACSASSGVAAAVSNLQQLEAIVFECLLGFAERVLPGYYSPAMVAPQVDQRVLSHLASEHLPALSARLIALGLSPAQPCPAWLLAGFAASNMPLATVARLWDVAFFERSGAAFMRGCLALLHLFSGAFEAALDCCDAGLLLQALPGLAFDSDRLLGLARDVYSEVDPPSLLALQHCFRAEVLAEIEQAAAAARKQQHSTPPRPVRVPTAQPVAATDAQAPSAVAASSTSDGGVSSSGSDGTKVAAEGSAGRDGRQSVTNDISSSSTTLHYQPIVVHSSEDVAVSDGGAAASILPPADDASTLQQDPPWVPDFDEPAAAAGRSAGGKAASSSQQLGPGHPGGATPNGQQWQQQLDAQAREEGDEREDDAAEETGSLLAPQQPPPSQQQQQQGLSGMDRSSGGGRWSRAAGCLPVAGAASSGGGGLVLKTHSVEVSRSRAIAQAMAIAAVPGLPVLPCIAVNTPKQQQQQPHHAVGNSTAHGSRGSAFLRSLGVPSSTQQQQMLQHSHSSNHTTRVTGSLRSASASAAAAAAALPAAGGGATSGLHQHYSYSSGDSLAGPSLLRCPAAADDSDRIEDAEGSGWMLLGGSSPRVAAAATAAAAAATAAAGSNGNSRADGAGCGSPMAAAAAAAGCNVKLLCDNLRDNYGLPTLTATMRELALAVQRDPAAAGDAAASSNNSPGITATAEAGGDSIAAPDVSPSSTQLPRGEGLQSLLPQQTVGGSSSSSSCKPLAQQCLQLAGCALAAAEQLVGDLAQQTASVTALQCQLDRSMGRLEQQDAELASRDEAIDRLRQQVLFYESLSGGGSSSSPTKRQQQQRQQQHRVVLPADPLSAGASMNSSSGREDMQGIRQSFGVRRQQQLVQQATAAGADGSNSGQGFVAAALARFGSPTKGRGPSRP